VTVVETVDDETVETVTVDVTVTGVIRAVTRELAVIHVIVVIPDRLNQEVIREVAMIQIILEDPRRNETRAIVVRQEIIQEDIPIIIPSRDPEVHRFAIIVMLK